jgi:hypothetical protein
MTEFSFVLALAFGLRRFFGIDHRKPLSPNKSNERAIGTIYVSQHLRPEPFHHYELYSIQGPEVLR